MNESILNSRAAYPTSEHQRAAEAIVDFFRTRKDVEAVLLVNSCARGKATRDSCLDIAVLVSPDVFARELEHLEKQWLHFYSSHAAFESLKQAGRFSVVHFDYFDGSFLPTVWDDGGGPDGFELEIGNRLVYSVPLWEGGDYFRRLKAAWLPYYEEALRQQRLTMVRHVCLEDLDHIAWYVGRELYFAAFDRLCRAFQEFLQALFIAHRTYPLAYNKWIREQVEEILGRPDLYRQLPPLLQISRFESGELIEKAEFLKSLVAALGTVQNQFTETDVAASYRHMAAEEARESEALEWAEATLEDVGVQNE